MVLIFYDESFPEKFSLPKTCTNTRTHSTVPCTLCTQYSWNCVDRNKPRRDLFVHRLVSRCWHMKLKGYTLQPMFLYFI